MKINIIAKGGLLVGSVQRAQFNVAKTLGMAIFLLISCCRSKFAGSGFHRGDDVSVYRDCGWRSGHFPHRIRFGAIQAYRKRAQSSLRSDCQR